MGNTNQLCAIAQCKGQRCRDAFLFGGSHVVIVRGRLRLYEVLKKCQSRILSILADLLKYFALLLTNQRLQKPLKSASMVDETIPLAVTTHRKNILLFPDFSPPQKPRGVTKAEF